MTKVIGPLLSFEARGNVAKILSFQRRPSGAACIRYSKPGSRSRFTPSAGQQTIRTDYREAVAAWQTLTPTEKEAWNLCVKPQ